MPRSDQRALGGRTILTFLIAVAAALAGVPLRPPPAAAAGVVGTGTPESCTDGALKAALARGGLVTFNCGGVTTIDVAGSGARRILADTVIDGGGLTTISADGDTDVFLVPLGSVLDPPGADLTVRNLTVVNGRYGISNGGHGTVTVANCHFTGNTRAIDSDGPFTVTNSTFVANRFAISGWGTITASSFLGNSEGAVATGRGLDVADSTFSANGGVAIASSNGPLTVTNSTFVGNGDGAIDCYGSFTVTNSTIAGNGGNGISAHPTPTPGPFLRSASASLVDSGSSVRNTIFADSANQNCLVDPGAVLEDDGDNLEDGASCGFGTTSGSLSNTDPELDPMGLRDNGGPTLTIALSPGSPAIDAGDPAVCAAGPVYGLDQRGHVRPGVGHTRCSIGAYEADAIRPTCTGDCSGDGVVTVDELNRGVNIALGLQPAAACPVFSNAGGAVGIAQLVAAVNDALSGCGAG